MVLCECIVQRCYLFFVKLHFDNIMSIIMKVSYMKSNNEKYTLPLCSTDTLAFPPIHSLGVEKQALTTNILSFPLGVCVGLCDFPAILVPRLRGCLICDRGNVCVEWGYGGRRGFSILLFKAFCLIRLG